MAGSYFTTYLLDKIIDHNLRGEAWTPPEGLWAKKHIGDPTEAGTAFPSTVTTRDEIVLSEAAGAATTLTADANWLSTVVETVTHLTVWDASTAGHCLAIIELAEPINCGVGDTLELSSLAISFRAPESL